jgi:acyl transferase domain-containing protein
MKEEKELLILSPFETPDVQLVLKTIKAGGFGVLHLGKENEIAKEMLKELSGKTKESFGICISPCMTVDFTLPENVTKVIVPFGYDLKLANKRVEILYQTHSLEEAERAIIQKVSAIVVKGSESTGKVAEISSFDLFRKIIEKSVKSNTKIYIQGGIGVHTSAAFLALGAQGVIFDLQIALFPECNIPQELKNSLKKPEPNKTLIIGQDICLAADFVERYKCLKSFIAAVFEATYGHLWQAKNLNVIDYNNFTIADTKNEELGLYSDLLCWEKQIDRMLQKEKNFSKHNLVFSIDVADAFFLAFVSIMAATVAAKGIKIGILTKSPYNGLKLDTEKILSGLKNISPVSGAVKPLDIAVVGMECIFPGAANIDEYWKNILFAKDSVTEIPDSHWNKEIFYKPKANNTDFSTSKWGGFIPTIEFDPVEFGIAPQSLFMTSPSQLLSLLVVKRALENAGYMDFSECDFENVSIFFGANSMVERIAGNLTAKAELRQLLGALPDKQQDYFLQANEYTFPGMLPNIVTGRTANRLNFKGRNYTIDAACASSLAALDVACQELCLYHSDMVILGGVDMHNSKTDYIMFSSSRVLSSIGRCASFDAEADGIVLGEGVGVLVLKRLEDAEQDGNKIYAVIKGLGGSSDGRNFGVTTPSRKGETKALERAYQNAGILPSQAGLIETHGTGTVVGDRVELSVLTDLFLNSGSLPNQTCIGSVKSQIGHTKCAAGVGGLIKTILSVYHRITPPTIHLNKPNLFYDPQNSPFVFNKRAGLWGDDKRYAGVSAFGFGGTNFHAVIENYQTKIQTATVLNSWPSELFVFRGNELNDAKILMQKVKKLLLINNSLRLVDIAYSLALYSDKEIQVSVIAGSIDELLTKIKAVLEDRIDFKIYHRNVKEGKVAFLFSGQGSKYINMARDLFVVFPPIRRLLDKNKEYIRILFPETAFDEETKEKQEKALTDTRNAQPLMSIVDLAIAEYLRFLGIVPDMLAGHGCGELPALCFAGVIAPDDLVALSKERALATLNAIGEDKGKLVAVILTEEELKPLLEDETEVWAVNYNSPKQIVLAGTTAGIDSFVKKAVAKNIICAEINVDCAFHSPLSEKAEDYYANILANCAFKEPEIAVWSNMTTEMYPKETDKIKADLAKHLVKPIHFTRQIENMYENGARIFIETGPGRVLLGLVEAILGKKAVTIQIENKSSEGITYFLRALGQYLSFGKEFQIERLFEDRNVSFLCIDEPEQYRKASTNWSINGIEAYPSKENPLYGKNRLNANVFTSANSAI